MTRSFFLLCFFLSVVSPAFGDETTSDGTSRIAFLVVGDPQYLAEESESPQKLDPYSEQANARAIKIIRSFA